jgi:hypothetical protein
MMACSDGTSHNTWKISPSGGHGTMRATLSNAAKRTAVTAAPTEERRPLEDRSSGCKGSRVSHLYVDTDGAGAMRTSGWIVALVFSVSDV